MTDAKAAKLAMQQIADIVATLDTAEIRLAALCGAVRAVVKYTALHENMDRAALLDFFIRRLNPAPPSPNLLAATDRIVFDHPDCNAVAVCIIGGPSEGGSTAFPANDGPETRARLVAGLRAMASGLEQHRDDGATLPLDPRKVVLQ